MLLKFRNILSSPQVTTRIRFVLDECLPPILRDRRWFFAPILALWNSRRELEFKRNLPSMTDEQIQELYERLLPRKRSTDMTPKTSEFVLSHIVGDRVLEVGCGDGDLSIACAKRGYHVLATDFATGNLEQLQKRVQYERLNIELQTANVECLPFPDKSFDVTLCLHTLEHVRDLCRAITELKRVTRKRVIVVVPRQRYYRYTCDYHLHFFWDPEQLLLAMNIRHSHCIILDRSLCYWGDLEALQSDIEGR